MDYHISDLRRLRIQSVSIRRLLYWRPRYILYFIIPRVRWPVLYADEQGRTVVFDSFEDVLSLVDSFRGLQTVDVQLMELSQIPQSRGNIVECYSDNYLRKEDVSRSRFACL
ncbi:hypothetical protein [Spartinivicinus ruber]|uniref:hypothetical protein n=1 Tax=Spartinivicinus ruber TaxID=2683272 RepID=UPI0013D76683|nr:hypothetical protein [Spartinivicinus ruber]